MTYNKEEVKKIINRDNPNYKEIANTFSEADIPLITELVREPDKSVSAKALVILSLMDFDSTYEGIEFAVNSNDPILKISAAQALRNKLSMQTSGNDLIPNKITELLNKLNSGEDAGVKKYTRNSINSKEGYSANFNMENDKSLNQKIKRKLKNLSRKFNKYF